MSPSSGANRRAVAADAALAVAVFAFCVSSAAIVGSRRGEEQLDVTAVLVLIAACAPLAVRRRWPIGVWLVSGIATSIFGWAEWPDPLVPLSAFVGLATVVECCSRRVAVVAWIVSTSAASVALVLSGDSDALDAWVVLVTLVIAPVVGDRQRARAAYLAELQANADRAERDRARDVRAAQLAERSHLARELHDVVAHHVSMIVVQAEAGASVASAHEGAGATSVQTFDAVAANARRTLSELRTLLGVLRTDDEVAPMAPVAGIDQIAGLIDAIPAHVLRVELSVAGAARELPPAIDLSAYRVVQEGLTNVVKHAGARCAQVRIEHRAHHLDLSVVDDGDGRGSGAAPGHGLDGLRERVALLGGTLDAGALPSGGFRLHVSLPVPS